MTVQIEAIDGAGIPRTYGIGYNRGQAIHECVLASEQYLLTRADIDALYLRDADTQKPVIEASTKQQWKVSI